MKASLAFAASLIASVAAHATFQELWVNGVDQGNYCVRLPPWNSPVTDVTSNDIACNLVSGTGTSANLCSVQPGDSITVEMHQQPNDRSCANEAIGGAHYGPVIIYLAKVDDAKTAVGYQASWFKIAEIGLPSNNPDYWGTEVLNDNCGHYTFTLPSVAPGNYLLRAEVIALHVASSVGGAQFYISCYQLQVGGSGSASPATVKFPGAYSASDPGILINIYTSLASYIIPGPSPYGTTSPAVATTAWPTTATWNTALQPSTVPTAPVGASTGGSSSSTSSTSSTRTSSTSSVRTSSTSTRSSSTSSVRTTSTSSSKASSSSSSSGGSPLYGQCGGQGWTGPTTCAQGTCTYSNPYYSQCL